MLVYDTIPFFNELDLLEIRLKELWPVVDRFYLQEAAYTFSGKKKPFYFADNRERFKPYLDKIEHSRLFDPPAYRAPLAFDQWQKQSLLRQLSSMPPSSLVIVADTDEIVRREVVEDLRDHWACQRYAPPVCEPELTMCCHWLNCVRVKTKWVRAKLIRASWLAEAGYDAPRVRNMKCQSRYEDAGWHFTSLRLYFPEKIGSWGHQEYNRPPYNTPEYQEKAARLGLDPFGRGHKHEFRTDLSFLPNCVQEEPERYAHLIYIPEEQGNGDI